MKLRKYHIAIAAAALLAASCAVEKESTANEEEKVFLEAWIHVHCPEAQRLGTGVYVLDDKPSESREIVGNSGYAIVTYTQRDIEGNITESTDSTVAQQLGNFSPANYYGKRVWLINQGAIYKGVAEMLEQMTVGSTRTALIPKWLKTYKTYSTEEEYMKDIETGSHAIYTVTVHAKTQDITEWQLDSLRRFAARHEFGDTTSKGFYYKTLKAAANDEKLPKDTTVYINYTGRLLNGQVFDTTIKDTAKRYNIYNSGKTYKPVPVKVAEKVEEITLDGSSVIKGFAQTIAQMKAMERGVGVFYSDLGYGTSGSGNTIPGYSPLLFDVELVEKPKEQ